MNHENPSWLEHLGLIVCVTGSLVVAFIGMSITQMLNATSFATYLQSAIAGAILWNGFLVAFGIRFVPQATAFVVERFGKYMGVLRSGPRLILPFIDKVKSQTLKAVRLNLYEDEPNNTFDFLDDSAPVRIQVWYKILQTVTDAEGFMIDVLDDSIQKFFYSNENPENWIEEQLDHILRTRLQALSIDDAQKQAISIAADSVDVINNIHNIGDSIGVEISRVLITDIVLSQKTIEARQQVLEGDKAGAKAALKARGYALSINAIIQEAGAKGTTVSWEQAEALFNQQRALETLATTGANINIVGDNIGGVVRTLDINHRT
jgi:regulator of protease activity HflC (stomatin/prohibitin superfamily)